MNKKGFTVVELITSFALTMVITVFLFEVLIDIKDIYVETAVKTSIQQKLAVISKNVKRVIAPRGTTVICSSSNSCVVNGANNIIIPTGTNPITVGSQTFTLPESVTITAGSLSQECTPETQDCFLKMNLTLKHPNLSKDYTYQAVFYYCDYTK